MFKKYTKLVTIINPSDIRFGFCMNEEKIVISYTACEHRYDCTGLPTLHSGQYINNMGVYRQTQLYSLLMLLCYMFRLSSGSA
jgi:hypothetical protein